ncbi:MAG: ECF transporter S component, partial [Christensenellaceae bacterium]
ALAFVVSLLEFPIFSAVPFLKLDFGNAFILLAAFIFGPVEGFVVCFVKELLRVLIYSHTFGVGELANFLITSAFILIPSIVYQFKKGLPSVIVTLVIACFVQIVAALLTNRFINFPMYGAAAGFDGVAKFHDVFWLLVAFNAIKSVSVSLICILLYKKLKYVLDKI